MASISDWVTPSSWLAIAVANSASKSVTKESAVVRFSFATSSSDWTASTSACVIPSSGVIEAAPSR